MHLRRKVLLVVGVCAFTLLAGCTQEENALDADSADGGMLGETEADMAEVDHTELWDQFDPLPSNGTSDWYFMETAADQDGEATGYMWNVPADAPLVENSRGYEFLVMELAPIMPEGTESTLESWGIFAFEEREGEAVMVGQVSVGPWHEHGGTYATTVGNDVHGMSYTWDSTQDYLMQPKRLFLLYFEDAESATDVRLVLHAKTSSPGAFGVAMRLMDQDEYDLGVLESTSDDLADFMGKLSSDQPVGLERLGTAPSIFDQAYMTGTWSGYVWEAWVPGTDFTKTVPNDMLMPDPVQRWTVDILDTSRRGWSMGYIVFGHYSGVGTYDVGFDARGASEQHSGNLASYEITEDYSGFSFTLEGEGTSGITADITMAGADTLDKGIYAGLQGLGAPLEEIIGIPSTTDIWWSDAMDPAVALGWAVPYGPSTFAP